MKNNCKYKKLEEYFKSIHDDNISLSFEQIENILGFKLPQSSYKYPACWSNSGTHPIEIAWLNNGFYSKQINLVQKTITFYRHSNHITQSQKIINSKSKICFPNLTFEESEKFIYEYYNETFLDKHHRFLSWNHCYNTFTKLRKSNESNLVDYLSLHLGFYLASWGMYRGSAFLLKNDYKIHNNAVKIILDSKYDSLVGISAQDLIKEENLDLIEDISTRIRDSYATEQECNNKNINYVSDTLVTKILLGTLGCTPAFDRFFKNSIKNYKISTSSFNKKSLQNIAIFYCFYNDEFEKLRIELSKCGTIYPPMKLIDMCFFQASYKSKH